MKIYEQYLKELEIHLTENNETRFVAQQLIRLHKEATFKEDPLIVELGVDRGQSTKIFLNAIHNKKNSKLISLDIKDCSNVSNSEKWEFVQQDSADIDKLLIKKPEINIKGIDLLYVDSLHTSKHVEKEIYNFFQYLNKDALIFFDDIDSDPYMNGQRKDSVSSEIANRKIFKLLESIFRSNMHQIDFEIMRGSTGLGIFRKISKKGEKLFPPIIIKERNNHFLNRFLQIIFFKKAYKHDKNSLSSFLISSQKTKK